MTDNDNLAKKIEDKLDALLEVSQYLFILEALKSGMSKEDVRSILKINMNRITAISKHLTIKK